MPVCELSTTNVPRTGRFGKKQFVSNFWHGVLRIILVLYSVLGGVFAYADQGGQPGVSNPDSPEVIAASNDSFLSSLGINTHVSQGVNPGSYVLPLRYLGIRNIRDSRANVAGLIMLHQQAGVRVDLIADDLDGVLVAARSLAKSGAMLSLEGPNEPNNFPIAHKGQMGGGAAGNWIPVAEFQKDLYAAVKSDPELKRFPIFHVSEGGAETENVGLQYLTIPANAGTLFPEGTKFADYANPHNYVCGVRLGYVDNQAWQAADPTLNGYWDGLYGEYGRTWRRHFPGYSNAELETLPRVTTETGWDAAHPEDERVQGTILVNTYLAQFKRGWRYTFVYQLGEGEGGGGNQGVFHQNWTPKLAATYIHNLTSILADNSATAEPAKLRYSIPNEPANVHDLLLQRSDGVFQLAVWGEQVRGSNNITINLANAAPTVKIYDTTIGDMPIEILTNVTSIPLAISDHAMIVEIR
jgi:hypothetical protein